MCNLENQSFNYKNTCNAGENSTCLSTQYSYYKMGGRKNPEKLAGQLTWCMRAVNKRDSVAHKMNITDQYQRLSSDVHMYATTYQ